MIRERDAGRGAERARERAVRGGGVRAHEFERIGIPLLRHEARAGRRGIVEPRVAERGRAPDHELFARARRGTERARHGVQEVERHVAIADRIERVARRRREAEQRRGLRAIQRQRRPAACARTERTRTRPRLPPRARSARRRAPSSRRRHRARARARSAARAANAWSRRGARATLVCGFRPRAMSARAAFPRTWRIRVRRGRARREEAWSPPDRCGCGPACKKGPASPARSRTRASIAPCTSSAFVARASRREACRRRSRLRPFVEGCVERARGCGRDDVAAEEAPPRARASTPRRTARARDLPRATSRRR